jgi:hypothetical protein
MSGKKVDRRGLLGQEGVNLVEKLTLRMDCLWYPTGQLEAGIDGTIEIRDPSTQEVSGSVLRVQVKATASTFPRESPSTFEWPCDQRDLDYWLNGNTPVLLIVTRPRSDEAYAICVNEYFADPALRKQGRVHFDKNAHRFDETSRSRLTALATPSRQGLYLAPPPLRELIYSNLIQVSALSERLFIGDALFHDGRSVYRELVERATGVPRDWIVKSGRMLSFRDLREFPWNAVCDTGTVEEFDTNEWALTNEPDIKRDFVELLNRALQEKLFPDIRFNREMRLYYVTAPNDIRRPRVIRYRNVSSQANRTAYRAYSHKGVLRYCRHAAFSGRFERIDGEWYLEVVPSYLYTSNGREIYPYYERLLSGMRRLERNQAVLSQTLLWAHLLTKPSDMFGRPYPFLQLGAPKKFEIESGVDDELWLQREDKGEAKLLRSAQLDMIVV